MNLQDELQKFIASNTGKSDVGDTPENKGQCVGLSEAWIDILGLPHVWGNAVDLLNNADKNAFDVVLNSPANSPAPGDILVFDAAFGEGFGHTGVVIKADVNSLDLFEQNDHDANDPTGACQTKTYNYDHVVGWLHPKVLSPTQTQEVSPQQLIDQLQAQVQATSTCQTQLKTATDQITALQQQLDDALVKNKDLQSKVNDLTSKYDAEVAENIALNTSLADLSSSKKDYALESKNAQDAQKEAEEFVQAITDSLHLQTAEKSLADITEEALTEIAHLHKQTDTTPFQEYKKIVQHFIDSGLNDFLKEHGLEPVTVDALLHDASVSDRISSWFELLVTRLHTYEKTFGATEVFVKQKLNLVVRLWYAFKSWAFIDKNVV